MAYPGEKERRKARRAQQRLASAVKRKYEFKIVHKKKPRRDDKHVDGYDSEKHSSLYDYI